MCETEEKKLRRRAHLRYIVNSSHRLTYPEIVKLESKYEIYFDDVIFDGDDLPIVPCLL